jgi:hypothetical protein
MSDFLLLLSLLFCVALVPGLAFLTRWAWRADEGAPAPTRGLGRHLAGRAGVG